MITLKLKLFVSCSSHNAGIVQDWLRGYRRGSRGTSNQFSLVAGVQFGFKSDRELLWLHGPQYGPDGSKQCCRRV